MAVTINRAPWNALVDDSGQNLDGSIWNKAAIKTVLLDPIDASIAATGSQLLLKQSSSLTAATNAILSPALPALTPDDTLQVVLSVNQSVTVCPNLYFTAASDALLMRLDDLSGGSLGIGASGMFSMLLRMAQINPKVWDAIVTGAIIPASAAPIVVSPVGRLQRSAMTTANWTSGGWQLAIYSPQTGGGVLYFSWAIFKL